ncbi:thioesterase domain-containing protein [Pseudomonas maumuensis]|uniref:Thioesterase domain-containing protein n=1 Tax=Pseudomonas maumuensis TaxID=2842354 RepID=A0ABX8NKE0_9PSED|nr:thioesterase domain-containing protein [Pseudomonas maumuensis]QXH56477.1 hypothetical protein KSS90_24685 [Pseudomonas maumuensis]
MQTRQDTTPDQPPRIRLICLASTRQQLAQYRTWARTLSDPIELVAVDVPSIADPEQSLPVSGRLTQILLEQLQPYLVQPHAVFAQGLGAHIALALIQQVQSACQGLTRHLFVSSCDSPQFSSPHQPLHVPMTVLYPPGSLAAMLGWHSLARRELELIELPVQAVDSSLLNQRLVRIFNAHLGLLSY